MPLNASTVGLCRTSKGREFQSFGPAREKALFPSYDVFNAIFIKQMDLLRIFKQKANFGYQVYCDKIKSEFCNYYFEMQIWKYYNIPWNIHE